MSCMDTDRTFSYFFVSQIYLNREKNTSCINCLYDKAFQNIAILPVASYFDKDQHKSEPFIFKTVTNCFNESIRVKAYT